MKLPVKVGDTITVKEADYAFGTGDLKMRIIEVPPERTPDGSDWIKITGIEINWDGREIGERTALIRRSALKPSS